MNPNGTGISQLTRNTRNNVEPTFSSNGRKIAFTSNRNGNHDIFTMSATGARQLRVTRSQAGDRSPAWSPNGRTIAFSSERNGNWDLYIVNQDRSSLIRLTTDSAPDSSPAWSPDGTKIAFVRGGGIYVMNATRESTTNIPQRISPPDAEVGHRDPAWSPDGNKIAFSRGFVDILIMNADGSSLTSLAPMPHAEAVVNQPAWSPDGTKISFAGIQVDLETSDVYVMRAVPASATNRPVRLTRNGVHDTHPDWQPLP